ncbi:MAG TPA: polyamine aminopropyltransferase, partial [Chitinophaga sp.]|nr:polyamine aminopropyltransferase [Chitinophaga sp.]
FDYIGALLASLIFPLLLVPHLGLIRTSLFFGILNVGVGWYLAHRFSRDVRQAAALKVTAILLLLAQAICFVFSERIMSYSETMLFDDHVVYSTSTPYQRIVLTKNKRELRLFLNGNLQFSTADEYRYHEALVHPAFSTLQHPENVLVLGGGDGLAVREILRYPSIKQVTLVDLDPAMTRLFSTQEILVKLNDSSLLNRKVHVHNADAFSWLRNNKTLFDAIVVDFPDPSNFSIGKLYSTTFYRLLKHAMKEDGIAVIQSTSPYVAPKSFWCVDTTLRSVGLHTVAYHNYVPSFGEWGYIMAMARPEHNWFSHLPSALKFLNPVTIQQMLTFPEDMKAHQLLDINKLNNQALVKYFEEEWNKYLEH